MEKSSIGILGSREMRMGPELYNIMYYIVDSFGESFEFNVGCASGVDEEFTKLAIRSGVKTNAYVVRSSYKFEKAVNVFSFVGKNISERNSKRLFFERIVNRNKSLVNNSDFIIAFPFSPPGNKFEKCLSKISDNCDEERWFSGIGSGTWSTILYSYGKCKKLLVIPFYDRVFDYYLLDTDILDYRDGSLCIERHIKDFITNH